MASRAWSLFVGFILNLFGKDLLEARPGASPLNDYITYYEPVRYDHRTLLANHHRTKRSAQHLLHLEFQAHKRVFKLRLSRDTSVFSNDVVMENSHGPIFYDTSRAYVGQLADDSSSFVHGIVTQEGLFEGKITTKREQYMVEKAQRFFSQPQDFHSVIYKHSDIQMSHLNSTRCKSEDLHHKMRHNRPDLNTKQKEDILSDNSRFEAIHETKKHDLFRSHWRHKRSLQIDPTKITCTLFLQADHLFYKKFGQKEETVIEQLTQHVQGVNYIYSTIDFDVDGIPDNINFIIKRIKVHSSTNASGYKFLGNYGVETFLELFSEDNFDDFCLAYMFTFRDFEGGTLGLAWTGDLQNAGGVCERNGQFRGSFKSLNSGIVTILNYSKDVPSTVSHVTMAHEIGHNMGSQHDPDITECSPSGDQGNYIMYARATSGDKPNNNKFSTCSKKSMAQVMAAKARCTQGCFITPVTAICGNGVVEEGEECDCGWDDECRDQCCHPKTSLRARGKPCTRRPGAQCSPSQGPCCSNQCQLITRDDNVTCRVETSCKHAAYCDGTSALCPFSNNKPDRTPCDEDYVCYKGECSGSICLAYGLEACQCAPQKEDDYNDENLCKICCKEARHGKPCRPSEVWSRTPYRLPDLKAKPGTPCNDYKGYCDVFLKCREVDPEGPLANLKKLIFSPAGMRSLKQWLTEYWYVVLAAGAGFAIFMAIFVKLCSPKKKKQKQKKQTSCAKTAKASSMPVRPRRPPTGGGPHPWVKRLASRGKERPPLVQPPSYGDTQTLPLHPPPYPGHRNFGRLKKETVEGWV